MHVARLLFVATVEESHRLVCQAPGCGRGIAKAVHVIRDQTGAVRVVGSGCFAKLSGHEQATEHGATIPGFDGRRLTMEERALMVADTTAFVARVEARLRAEREAAQQAEERMRAEARGLREQPATSWLSGRQSYKEWKRPKSSGPEDMRPGERAHAREQLARFRTQQAREAARLAMQRRPELLAHSLDVVADAMAKAKTEYLERGLRMDAPDARSAIESAAVAALAKLSRRSFS